MTAYVNPGDRVILYAGNLDLGGLQTLRDKIEENDVQVISIALPAREPSGPPSVLVVFEKKSDKCEMCGWPDADAVSVDGAIVDEMPPSHDCASPEVHHPHVWAATTGSDVGRRRYCKGVAA